MYVNFIKTLRPLIGQVVVVASTLPLPQVGTLFTNKQYANQLCLSIFRYSDIIALPNIVPSC